MKPPQEVIDDVVFCVPIEELGQAVEMTRKRKGDTIVGLDIDTSDGRFDVVEEIELKLRTPQDPKKKKRNVHE